MPFVEGYSLEAVARYAAAVDFPRTKRCTIGPRKIAVALAYAHKTRHRASRSSKPGNVIISPIQGENPLAVKVIDFGIAKQLDAHGSQTMGAMGTPKLHGRRAVRTCPGM